MARVNPKPVEPEGSPESQLWIIGEAPGEDEVYEGRPFTGRSGELLFGTLERAGISRSECFITNVSKYYPEGNKFPLLEGSAELDRSKQELSTLLQRNTPRVVVCVGSKALEFIAGLEGITNWRGSILDGNLFNRSRTIPILHPSFVLRDGTNYPAFELDIKRIKEELSCDELRLPFYSMVIDPDGDMIDICLDEILKAEMISVDIETVIYTDTLRCIGFATRKDRCFVFKFDTLRKREAIEIILESNTKKILQNGIFDTLILKENGYELKNYYFDTMIAQHILNPELPRGLDFLTSVYTRQPYYKNTSKEDVYVYNGKDCCCTLAIALDQIKELDKAGLWDLFNFELSEVEMARDISMAGLPLDDERRQLFSKVLNKKYNDKTNLFCQFVGLGSYVDMNPNSTKQAQAVIYDGWKLPEKIDRKSGNRTLDEDAVVALIAHTKDKVMTSVRKETKMKYEVMYYALKTLLEIRGLKKMVSSYIDIDVSPDGTIKSMFKVSSTETGRWAAEKYYDNTGLNAQTFPREHIEVEDAVN